MTNTPPPGAGQHAYPLPCAFCGSDIFHVDDDDVDWKVTCAHCHAVGPWMRTKDEAITAWNRRAALNAPARVDENAGWQLIETAPNWVGDDTEALVGQLNSEGRWVKVSLWMATWAKSNMIHRGATHWMRLPKPSRVDVCGGEVGEITRTPEEQAALERAMVDVGKP